MAVDPEALYTRYAPMVMRRCRQLLGDEERALDAMQDVFVQVVTKKDRLEDKGLSSLLYRMATHVSLNKIRSQGRRRDRPDGELVDRIASAEEPGAQSMARNALAKIFKGQRESTRVIATLHLLDGMTLNEVAKAVGLSVSGVRKRLRTLRAHVAELEGL